MSHFLSFPQLLRCSRSTSSPGNLLVRHRLASTEPATRAVVPKRVENFMLCCVGWVGLVWYVLTGRKGKMEV